MECARRLAERFPDEPKGELRRLGLFRDCRSRCDRNNVKYPSLLHFSGSLRWFLVRVDLFSLPSLDQFRSAFVHTGIDICLEGVAGRVECGPKVRMTEVCKEE